MADLNLGPGRIFINGEYVGEIKSQVIRLRELGYERAARELEESEWPTVILEDALDAEYISET